MTIPICVGSASGRDLADDAHALAPPPASKARRCPAVYAAWGPPLRNARSATAPHMIMYDEYMHALMQMAEGAPRDAHLGFLPGPASDSRRRGYR